MPWKRKAASRGRAGVMTRAREEGIVRLHSMDVAFAELGDEGIGGGVMSVRMRWFCGSWRRRAARSWPMNPAAPVMRILGIVTVSEEAVGCWNEGLRSIGV